MNIETSLERIATALEALTRGTVGTDAVPERRGPGRPPKATAAAPPAEEPAPETETGSFLEDDSGAKEPEVKPIAIEDVRKALVAYQKRTSPDKARAVLKKVGGVDTLKTLPADKWKAVIEATEE